MRNVDENNFTLVLFFFLNAGQRCHTTLTVPSLQLGIFIQYTSELDFVNDRIKGRKQSLANIYV